MVEKTHFGFRQVDKRHKAGLVARVFDSVADRYDLMNDLMSLGIHRLWKRFALTQAGLRSGQRVLDLAGGTGDVAALIAPRVGVNGQVVVADINASMLERGRDRLLDSGQAAQLSFVQADAESLPFADQSFHCITIAFGLRNVTDKERALASMYRVLRPGGRLLVLEFSKPVARGLAMAYDAYSFRVLPALGKLVTSDADSYRYLAESIRMHPDQRRLAATIEAAGFAKVDYFNLTGGIVALHRAFKL